MPKLKAQLHVHCKGDPIDNIKLTARQVIDHAARLNYDVLAITCHNVIIFTQELKEYAHSRRILLIPGIEKSIEKKHVLILNAHIDAQKMDNFTDLEKYRLAHPESLIIAVHPYFPSLNSLGKKFDRHHRLFDAVEYSWFHSKKINYFNKKAQKSADKYKLPLVSTSDNHLIKYFDYAYSFIDSEKDTGKIFTAIRENRLHIISHDLKWWQLPMIYIKMGILELVKKVTLK